MTEPTRGESPASLPPEHRGLCQEVRIAVVMYGGVSLAIYMNGVAQEIHRLVRATAVKPDDDPWRRAPLLDEVEKTEKVYRELGQILRRRGAPARDTPAEDAPIYTNFVVDVLSGTSAGGINAVFLAKALAIDGDLEPLKNLWMEEADISLLVNDRSSLKGLPLLTEQRPPRSLLNSERMYAKLLQAFDEMDAPGDSPRDPSPYVEELDLYVTSTDLHGTVIPLRLADGIVWERRYRNVFHFRYGHDPLREDGWKRNDFDASEENPDRNRFLAFASRATSAFPFAFMPMTLDQAAAEVSDSWRTFLRDQLLPKNGSDREEWARPEGRAFGDGGYLDNKPFSYAIDALFDRVDAGTVPVDRKLLYVEPAPKRPEKEPRPSGVPDAVENVGLALLKTPRYETIREDLEEVLERNRIVRWTDEVLADYERDFYLTNRLSGEVPDREKFAELDLARMIERKGPGYGSYQRLKVHILTDEIAAAFAAAAGYDRHSEQFESIRAIVSLWRNDTYVEYEKMREAPTYNRFLVDFDLPYRLRRLRFVRRKADGLLRMDAEMETILAFADVEWRPREAPEERAFTDAVVSIKREFWRARTELARARARLLATGERNPLWEEAFELGLGLEILAWIVEAPTKGARGERVELFFHQSKDTIDRAIDAYQRIVREASADASRTCKRALRPPDDGGVTAADGAARRCLWYYYQRYDDYDMILLPILHGTGLGEERDQVDVLRVSPLDARSLIDETDASDGRRKLAGTAVFNFGAFLDRGWRRNDHLWGRLDASERLISAMLPGDEESIQSLRERLVGDAHREIILEELRDTDRDEVSELLVQATLFARTDVPMEIALREMLEKSPGRYAHPALAATLRVLLEDEDLRLFLRKKYEVDRHLDRGATLEAAARASRVIARMLDDLTKRSGKGDGMSRWVARLAQVFWGIVLVAVPGNLANALLRHTLKILYVFELVLLAAGWVLLNRPVQRFAMVALGVTLALHVVTFLVEDYIGRRTGFRRWVVGVLLVTGVVFAVFGVAYSFAPHLVPDEVYERGWLPLAAAGGLIGVVALGRLWLDWLWPGLRRVAHMIRSNPASQWIERKFRRLSQSRRKG